MAAWKQKGWIGSGKALLEPLASSGCSTRSPIGPTAGNHQVSEDTYDGSRHWATYKVAYQAEVQLPKIRERLDLGDAGRKSVASKGKKGDGVVDPKRCYCGNRSEYDPLHESMSANRRKPRDNSWD